MFHLFASKRPLTALLEDGIDRHCHILPGVDDGVPTMEAALEVIREMQRVGIRGAYCTPHIMRRFPNTPSTLRARFEQLAELATGLGFELRLAAEYMIDETFDATLRADEPLTWDGRYLLVELPQYMLPPGWMDSIALVKDLGYTPVLAHPERYGRLFSVEELEELAHEGILFQGNIGSLSGYYDRHAQTLARKLQKKNLYSFWGTDTHSLGMLRQVLQL